MTKRLKKKDYMRLFVSYCKKNEIYYRVGSYGSLLEVSMWWSDGCTDACPPQDTMFGTKSAYDWLVSAHKKARDNA